MRLFNFAVYTGEQSSSQGEDKIVSGVVKTDRNMKAGGNFALLTNILEDGSNLYGNINVFTSGVMNTSTELVHTGAVSAVPRETTDGGSHFVVQSHNIFVVETNY